MVTAIVTLANKTRSARVGLVRVTASVVVYTRNTGVEAE